MIVIVRGVHHPLPCTYAIDENYCRTVELRGQGLAGESTESPGDEDEAVTPVVRGQPEKQPAKEDRWAGEGGGHMI
jgi:hypothetical protein